MIQHIVINGGGPTGWMTYGALKYLFETKVFLKIVFAFRNDWKELYKFSKEMIAKDNCKSFVDIQDVMMNVKLFNDLIEIDNKNQPG